MKLSRYVLVACALALTAAGLAGCSSDMNANTANANATPAASPTPAAQALSVVGRPQRIS